jgi:hypothetical protein
MKIRRFWEIYHNNMENLPFFGIFPCIYGDMPRERGEAC